MANARKLEQLVEEYSITPKYLPPLNDDLKSKASILNREVWNVFTKDDCDVVSVKTYFNSLNDEDQVSILKFGIVCLRVFVQVNFTGPELEKKFEEFLSSDLFKNRDYAKDVSVNGEEINVNTRHPVLLKTAKIIFECCLVNNFINTWWYWRVLFVQQHVVDEIGPPLVSDADRLCKHYFQHVPGLTEPTRILLDAEIAHLYVTFHHVTKAKDYITSATERLGLKYDYVGIMGKRTRFQEKELAQLSLKVSLDDSEESPDVSAIQSDIPKILPLIDDTRLDRIQFAEEGKKIVLPSLAQKVILAIVKETLISTPKDELQTEELLPFIDLLLQQKSSFAVRTVALLLRCRLESNHKRTIERSLMQCEEIINSFKLETPPATHRFCDVFSTGVPPMWKVEKQYADILLNIGLVKNALDVYLKIHQWEEVIVCYTLLEQRHKAAEVIREQIAVRETVKLWCLLGDMTDDESCYEKAWELSKRRSYRAQRHWGNFLFARKRYKECIPHYERANSINPLQPQLWARLGFAALELERYQTAATAYRRYTNLEPDGFEAWNNLAQAYIQLKNKRNAHNCLHEAVRCNYENWKVWENLLVVSVDMIHNGDIIRTYQKLLDMKGKYLNVGVLSTLVLNVTTNVTDYDLQPSGRYLPQTRELLGRVVSVFPTEGVVWELYANLAPVATLKAQRLQRAYRGYTQSGWDKNPTTCHQVLHVCLQLEELVLLPEVEPKDYLINSVRLNVSSAITAVKKHDWNETRNILQDVSNKLDAISDKMGINNQ